jgi:RNA polymerase sigma factor (sigma-70 family)
MVDKSEVETSLTLLHALREAPPDNRAWDVFLSRYRPLITDWCRQWGLTQVDTEDAIEDLLVKLLEKDLFAQFDVNRRFRAWLATIVRNIVRDHHRQRQRRPAEWGAGGSDFREQLDQLESPEGQLASELVEGVGEATRRLEEARRIKEVVQARVQARTWQAFELRVLHDLPAQVVAERLGMPVASVHQARHSVGKLLQAERDRGRDLGDERRRTGDA